MSRRPPYRLLLACAALCVWRQAPAAEMQGIVTVLRQELLTIHSYMAPADGLFATSQIIETPHALCIVDTQYTRGYAQEVREYAQHLNKPIARVYVSHAHPDHANGLGVFADRPLYTLPEIKAELDARAARGQGAANAPAATAVAIQALAPEVLASGREVIDGVTFYYETVGAAEGSAHLLIRLPQAHTLVAQDLIYNGVHLYSGQNEFERWIAVLEALQSRDGDTVILAGHGKPAGREVYAAMLGYLRDLRQLRASARSGDELRQQLVARYPDHLGSRLIDISLPRLYPPPR